jgi:predicted nucleic-acid-binding Zn-ribbon protein
MLFQNEGCTFCHFKVNINLRGSKIEETNQTVMLVTRILDVYVDWLSLIRKSSTIIKQFLMYFHEKTSMRLYCKECSYTDAYLSKNITQNLIAHFMVNFILNFGYFIVFEFWFYPYNLSIYYLENTK